MKTWRRSVVLSALAALGITVAGNSTAQAEDTGRIHITRIAPWQSTTQIAIPTPVICANTENKNIEFRADVPNAQRNFDIALDALVHGLEVDIQFTCVGEIARGSAIRIFP